MGGADIDERLFNVKKPHESMIKLGIIFGEETLCRVSQARFSGNLLDEDGDKLTCMYRDTLSLVYNQQSTRANNLKIIKLSPSEIVLPERNWKEEVSRVKFQVLDQDNRTADVKSVELDMMVDLKKSVDVWMGTFCFHSMPKIRRLPFYLVNKYLHLEEQDEQMMELGDQNEKEKQKENFSRVFRSYAQTTDEAVGEFERDLDDLHFKQYTSFKTNIKNLEVNSKFYCMMNRKRTQMIGKVSQGSIKESYFTLTKHKLYTAAPVFNRAKFSGVTGLQLGQQDSQNQEDFKYYVDLENRRLFTWDTVELQRRDLIDFKKTPQTALATGRHNFPILRHPEGKNVLFDLKSILPGRKMPEYGVQPTKMTAHVLNLEDKEEIDMLSDESEKLSTDDEADLKELGLKSIEFNVLFDFHFNKNAEQTSTDGKNYDFTNFDGSFKKNEQENRTEFIGVILKARHKDILFKEPAKQHY